MEIGEKIREARESQKMTQEELGRLTSTTKQTIYKYEHGIIRNIPILRLHVLSRALGVSVTELLGLTPEKKEGD